jgi:hypothetical protein
LPERSIAFEPPGHLLKRERAQLVKSLSTDALLSNEVREPEHAKVLRDRGTALLEVIG